MFPDVPCSSWASETYAYVTGTPRSCICATHASETFASIPSKPGKPTWPVASWIVPPLRSVGGENPIAGSTDFAPNSAWKPA